MADALLQRLSLCHGCMQDVPARDFAAAAAAAGFPRVTIRLIREGPADEGYPGNRIDAVGIRDLRGRMSDLGLKLEEVEYAAIAPETQASYFRPLFEAGAELGARQVIAIVRPGFASEAAMVERFGEVCAEARAFGLSLLLEFIAGNGVSTLQDAGRMIAAAGDEQTRITADMLHLMRSGGAVMELFGPERALIGSGQINDGPLAPPATLDARRWEMRADRRRPGEGEFPLAQFVAALPGDVPIGVEVQRHDAPTEAEGAVAEAHALMRAARAALGIA